MLHERVAPRVERAIHVTRQEVGRMGEQPHGAMPWVGSDGADQVRAAHVGEGDVEEDQVVVVARERLEGGAPGLNGDGVDPEHSQGQEGVEPTLVVRVHHQRPADLRERAGVLVR